MSFHLDVASYLMLTTCQVMIENARNLPRMDTFGLSDPFCAVTCGKGVRHKTKVIKNTLNPTWHEEFVYK